MLKIVSVPNTILTTPVKKVEKFDGSLQRLAKDMEETLTAQVNPQGVGLAAPQVGINLALFIIKPTSKSKTEAIVNPSAEFFQPAAGSSTDGKDEGQAPSKAKKDRQKLEGCLSLPKIWGSLKRAQKVLLEYQDVAGKIHKRWFSGFKAAIIQHEVDHLQGILFTQRALEQHTQLYEEKEGKLKKLEY